MIDAVAADSSEALRLVGLAPVMALTRGIAEIAVALVDGPVAVDHPALSGAAIRAAGLDPSACSRLGTPACLHGTFVAGILVAERGSSAPSICPACTLLVRPIFRETDSDGMVPSASLEDVSRAIVQCVNSGARIVNLSAATGRPTMRSAGKLREALDHAARRGVVVVAAAGNQGTLGGSEVTRHPAVIPVVACDLQGRPLAHTNLGRSPGARGLAAPGDGITSLVTVGAPGPRSGTSFAAAFVSGAVALLWSLFPEAAVGTIRHALLGGVRRTSVTPPVMDAWAAYELLARNSR